MYQNTTYKAYVAEAAAKVAAQISMQYTSHRDVSLLTDDKVAEKIAIASTNVAKHLANKLEEWWRCAGDSVTVMFDPDDTPYSKITDALWNIEDKLNDIKDTMESEDL